MIQRAMIGQNFRRCGDVIFHHPAMLFHRPATKLRVERSPQIRGQPKTQNILGADKGEHVPVERRIGHRLSLAGQIAMGGERVVECGEGDLSVGHLFAFTPILGEFGTGIKIGTFRSKLRRCRPTLCPMGHDMQIRVYYEDTDLAGIVYYANYLRFIERGRSEYLRAKGIDQMALKSAAGVTFAVRKLTAEYLKPAVMDDLLDLSTTITRQTQTRLWMAQVIHRDTTALFRAEVEIVCMKGMAPTRLPRDVIAKLCP